MSFQMNKRYCPSGFLTSGSFKEKALPLLAFKLALFGQLIPKMPLRSYELMGSSKRS